MEQDIAAEVRQTETDGDREIVLGDGDTETVRYLETDPPASNPEGSI